MNAKSLPKDPAQPDSLSYQTRDLEIFAQFDYDTYVKTFGEAPPAPLANQPAKSWLDTSKATEGEGTILYQRINPTTGVMEIITMEKSIARRVNIAGRATYPQYLPTPTPAQVVYQGIPQRGVDPAELSTLDEAKAMKAETGAVDIVDGTPYLGLLTVALNGEPRRMWRLVFADGRAMPFVGQLLVEKNRYGIGAPVSVVKDGPTAPDWTLAETNESVAKGEPYWVPQRKLLPNEKVVVTLAGGAQIFRTDLDAAPAAGGGFTAGEAEYLLTTVRDTNRKVCDLHAKEFQG